MRATWNVTPVAKVVPVPDIVNVPMPTTVTVTTGGQSAFDVYTTEKVITVPRRALPGLAVPELKLAWWEPPEHEAARAGAGVNTVSAASETATNPAHANRRDAWFDM